MASLVLLLATVPASAQNLLTNPTFGLRTGHSRTYSNPQGKAFRPVQDTSAFACP
jgi:hypothetical protein